MGITTADIELVSADDLTLTALGHPTSQGVRSVRVTAIVDSGAETLCVNENIRAQLGLRHLRDATIQLADGSLAQSEWVGPVEVRYLTRAAIVEALVIPGDEDVLLGAIPIEQMDLILDRRRQTLSLPPTRPYVTMMRVK